MSKIRSQSPSKPSSEQLPRIQAAGKIKREVERRRKAKGFVSGYSCMYGTFGITPVAIADRFVKIYGYEK